MTRRLALATGAAAVFSLALREAGSGYLAIVAFGLLAAALDSEKRPLFAALITAVAWTGLAIPALEGTALVIWWSLPALIAVHGIVWGVAGGVHALFVRKPLLSWALLPLLITGAEYVGSSRLVFGGAALELVAYTQADTILRGLAPWSGTSGVTLAVAAFGTALYLLTKGQPRPAIWTSVLLSTLMAVSTSGMFERRESGTVRVAVVQTADDPVTAMLSKYDDRLMADVMGKFEVLTHNVRERGAELVVWGETVLPGEGDSGRLPVATKRALGAAPVVLAGTRERTPEALFNSTMVWRGSYLELVSRKQVLVPIIESHFDPGLPTAPVPLQGANVGAFVCLDSLHGHISRESVRRGADLLVYVTDDTFAGSTASNWFHLATAIIRAAETRRSVVFANAYGPSALISASGEVVARTRVAEPGFLVEDLPLWTGPTPYAALGNYVGPACLLLLFIALAFAFLVRRSYVHQAPRMG